jgi:hypothetical protein
MRRCDSDSTLEPCVHVFLKVALVMFVCCRRLFFISIDLFFFLLYRFTSYGAVCLWCCWFLELLYIFQKSVLLEIYSLHKFVFQF